MNKYLRYSAFFLLQSFLVNAQETIYDYIKTDRFSVGFYDTLWFDANLSYEAYDYQGKKPYFVQIWHPMEKRNTSPSNNPNNSENWLSLHRLLDLTRYPNLEQVAQQIETHTREIVIRDFIAENFSTGQANDFGDYSYDTVFNLLGQLKTRSVYAPLQAGTDFPVIVYHHGSQSNSFENFALAEYFASRGFIFVASNFHLPFENSIWGLKPFDKLIKNEEEESLKSLVQFAQQLSNSPYIFFMGHSWGAQMGFRTFDNDTTIKALISLETTLEFKKDINQILELWPEVFQKIITEKACYPFPVMLCAATGQNGSFNGMESLNAPQVIFASTKEEFEHNAYTSLFYLRYFLTDDIGQTDKELLKDRLSIYVKHLECLHDFLLQVMHKETKEATKRVFIHQE